MYCRTIFFTLLVWCATGPALVAQAESGQLRAGACAVDVSPKQFPVSLRSGKARDKSAIHDPLHARAIVLNDGKTIVALAVLDALGAPPEMLNEAKQIASKKTGIPVDRILISSTHTHSAPPSNRTEGSPGDVAYRKVLIEGLAQAITQAFENQQTASLGMASHDLPEEVFNRRWFLQPGKMPANPFGKMDIVKMNPGTSPAVLERPAGPVDPELMVLSIQNAKRKPLALLANYALHYVGGIPKRHASADYFGEFARLMPSRLRAGQDFVAMMSNGASGDINNIPFLVNRPPREPFEQVRIVASKAADTAYFTYKKIENHERNLTIDMLERKVDLKYRRPSAEEVTSAQKVLALKDKSEIARLPKKAVNYARKVVQAHEREEDSLTVTIQAIRIGEYAIVGIPFETLVEIGLEIKDRSPFARTMVIGLANGRHGYLPTPEQHRLGGYETWLGTNVVQKDASVILTDNLLEMLKELQMRK
ncbi:hypothetical protein [Gimesia panareensis]|uniref:Neutral/alkaline non-lysosomal ceramidase n=1 Tax=Gimesia panareensis TaxID=2527978 RepID=A0A518A4C5_9PLAN|nr:hypothetical protein [Gimesia panareensis]QDT27576.1 Neutral/alkaline non-lysosomal ceramidase [Gimesia panareensis]QDU49603.1 Neutral/alkaline non-lysosomal ceramidase [Gimesia panareensis]